MFNVKHKSFNAPKPKIKSKNQNNSSPKCDDSSWFNSAGHSCLSVAITTATDRLATRLSLSLPWKRDDSRHDNPLSALRCGEGAAHLRICFLFTIFTVIYFYDLHPGIWAWKICRRILNASMESVARNGGDRRPDSQNGKFPKPNAFWISCVFTVFFLFIRVAVFSSLYFKGKILSSSSFRGNFKLKFSADICRASAHTFGWHNNEKRTERICHATRKRAFGSIFANFPVFCAANMPPPFSPVDFCQFFCEKKSRMQKICKRSRPVFFR